VLLEALGFRRVAEVRKRRRKAKVSWRGRDIEAALDDVDRVGRFVELEIVARSSEIEVAKSTSRNWPEGSGFHGTNAAVTWSSSCKHDDVHILFRESDQRLHACSGRS